MLPSAEMKRQESPLVIERRGEGGNQERTAFPKVPFGKGFGDKLVSSI